MGIIDRSRFEELKASGLLPSPKGVALAVMQSAQDENATQADIARLIKADPALSGRIVKAANGARYGAQRPVASIIDALTVLGLSAVRQLALGFSLVSEYRRGRCQQFDFDDFWSRSLATGLAMQAATVHTRRAAPEETFLIGLVSRIGYLALATLYPAEYSEVLARHAQGPLGELVKLEQERFKIDHNQLTAAMMLDWGLPAILVDAALHHENPALAKLEDESRPFVLTHSLHFASQVAGFCLAAEQARADLLPDLFLRAARVGISVEDATALIDGTVRDWREWGRLLDLPTQKIAPVAEIKSSPAAAAGAESLADELDEHRLLVVDSDPASRLLLDKVLTDAGYRVFTASSGREALSAVAQCRPQLIVSDWRMPEMDGLALCRTLRKSTIGRGAYILLLSAAESEALVVEAFEAGVDDYMLKPFNPRVLVARLRAGERVVNLQREIEYDSEKIRRYACELALSNRRLQEAALLDALTGLPNRRYAMERIHQEWSASVRAVRPLACMLLDVDHFKLINDNCGHDVGDMVLQRVAEVLKQTARTQDVICRIGGEEFLVLCPDTDAEAAVQCAERLRHAVAAVRPQAGNVALQVTVSVGVAAMDAVMTGPEALMKAADDALYAAKQAGRNRACLHQPRTKPGTVQSLAVRG